MSTIHEQIDELLAADLHGELPVSEQQTLHAHLVECATCRQTHTEHKTMNAILTDSLSHDKPDARFEQRVLSSFRDRVPDRGPGVMRFLVLAMRSHATQVAAVAVLLLALVQTGRMITGEGRSRKEAMVVSTASMAQSIPPRAQGGINFVADEPVGKVKAARKAMGASADSESVQSALQSAPAFAEDKVERSVATGSQIPTAEETAAPPPLERLPANTGGSVTQSSQPELAANSTDNRKLVRNASVELEIGSFDHALQTITGLVTESRGYVATTSSEKQENGKLRGEVVVKVLPQNLDGFLGKLRALGNLKNQSLTTEDVTKAYFDTDSRLKNSRTMEQRLIEILKKKSEDINDLLAVEKELGRVREEIEKIQGELKFMDSQVQFATVTIQLTEKDMNEPAAFLLKERAQLALFAPEVERIYNDIKALASPKVQITNATMDRDNTGRISARVSMLIAPEESESIIAKTKAMGRVENFQTQTERVAKGGEGMSENAKTERDKVVLNITISRDEQEQARQQTSLNIRTTDVNDRTKQLRELAEKQSGRIRSSSFSRDPNGREYANVSLRVPMKNYTALMQSLGALGKLENISVHRDDRSDQQIDEANAPADIAVQVYSQGNFVSEETGLIATIRRTVGQGAAALMWSVRMIGVALAFFAPWAIALVGTIWLLRRIRRARAAKADADKR